MSSTRVHSWKRQFDSFTRTSWIPYRVLPLTIAVSLRRDWWTTSITSADEGVEVSEHVFLNYNNVIVRHLLLLLLSKTFLRLSWIFFKITRKPFLIVTSWLWSGSLNNNLSRRLTGMCGATSARLYFLKLKM